MSWRVAVVALCVLASAARADVKLSQMFSDNMVLQRDMHVPVWGQAEPGEKVTVTIAGKHAVAIADAKGAWMAKLGPLAAGGPYTLSVTGKNTLTLTNVLVGEVWVCSGQSNMEFGMTQVKDAQAEIAGANHPRIRLYPGRMSSAASPQNRMPGEVAWQECTSQNVASGGWGGFSCVAYFFGRALHEKLNVPIGLIESAWGGTPIEAWTSADTLKTLPDFKARLETLAGMTADDRHAPTGMYNAGIAPLIPFGIRGVIWYQGEDNVWRGYQYRTLFPAMIKDWRTHWGQGDFPFGFVQIPPYHHGRSSTWVAELCEAQSMTLKAGTNVGMVVTRDIDDVNNIHPTNKQDVSKRLALWALAKVYGDKNLVYSGPIYTAMTVEGGKIRLQFEHCGTGLIAKDGKPLTEFTIAGADKNFQPAKAEISGNTVVVSSDQVAAPVAVRYDWSEDAQASLFNKEGLPASLFRTDDWPGVSVNAK